MITVKASAALTSALMARHTEYLQMADKEAADTGMPKGDERFVWGQCMMMLLCEVMMAVQHALRVINAKDDNLDKLVHAALERTKQSFARDDAARRARAQ
jgi:hypothetical protein